MPQQIDHEVLIASTCWTTSAQVLSWELDGYYCTGIDQYQKKAGGELSAKLSFQRRQNILGDILLTEVRNGLQCRKKKRTAVFLQFPFSVLLQSQKENFDVFLRHLQKHRLGHVAQVNKDKASCTINEAASQRNTDIPTSCQAKKVCQIS